MERNCSGGSTGQAAPQQQWPPTPPTGLNQNHALLLRRPAGVASRLKVERHHDKRRAIHQRPILCPRRRQPWKNVANAPARGIVDGRMRTGGSSSLATWWRRQDFEPGSLGWLANPFYFARRGLLEGLKEFFPQMTGELLDVGCGSKPYRAFIPTTRYVGMEIDSAGSTAGPRVADVYYDGRNFPFADQSFDGVLCSQVFEHVFTPFEFLAEIHRVLRPGGRLLLTVPFVWDEHEQPRDFARYSSFGLRAVLENAGFEVATMRKSMADGRVLFQLWNAYVFKLTRTRRRSINVLSTVGLMAPINLAGIVLGSVLPRNPDLYLDNIVLARKINATSG
jgi:SAM-dependent methyltransferase